jgi:hypothetical protein
MLGTEVEYKQLRSQSIGNSGSNHFEQEGQHQVTLIYGSHIDPKEVVKSRKMSPGPCEYNLPDPIKIKLKLKQH